MIYSISISDICKIGFGDLWRNCTESTRKIKIIRGFNIGDEEIGLLKELIDCKYSKYLERKYRNDND